MHIAKYIVALSFIYHNGNANESRFFLFSLFPFLLISNDREKSEYCCTSFKKLASLVAFYRSSVFFFMFVSFCYFSLERSARYLLSSSLSICDI